MEKNVLGETSFSPAFGLTEKDTVSSRKLRTKNKNTTARPNYYNMSLQKSRLSDAKTWQSSTNAQNIEVNLAIMRFCRDLMEK